MEKTKQQYYEDVFELFLKKKVPDDILHNYVNEIGDSYYEKLADFVGMNMRSPINEWSTIIGIIESVERMYEEAVSNGNIKRN